ncbi:hypothetical protein Ade02nite_42690 [Paractinoplanes deccanensis]|uniref:Uncharacterized protein n=1 Tax=Paractinoplanes deccanensis TaxID=113561 RepID=A0ABQ3Y6M2_9ACTN|nr:hypothetical protein [Actinoplanes deccanensis]GID75628.1 hypothetical protein Ade02nite_42690 [Actinoplanes deccanensis]
MPERPDVRDDSAVEHPPPLELSDDADDDAGDDDHESHDPYQPL